MGGARFVASADIPDHETLTMKGELLVSDHLHSGDISIDIFRIPGRKIESPTLEQSRGIGLSFDATNAESFLKIVSLVHGDSQRWETYWHRNDGNLVMLEAIRFLLWSGVVNSARHLGALVNKGWNRLVSVGLPEEDIDEPEVTSEMISATDISQS